VVGNLFEPSRFSHKVLLPLISVGVHIIIFIFGKTIVSPKKSKAMYYGILDLSWSAMPSLLRLDS